MLRRIADALAQFFARHPVWLALGVVVYILSPIDLAPEWLLGPLGYLDDLVILVVALVLRHRARQLHTALKQS
jgi:uncharacterized membrane protein YkvA (DUF1232 family)